MEALLARYWWAVGLRGLVALIFGILVVAIPHIALLVLISFFAAYALISGLIAIVMSFWARSNSRHWVWMLVQGITGVLIALITWRWPGVTLLALLAFIAAWALISGMGEIFQAIELRKSISNEWLMILSGILTVLFGVTLLLFPGSGAIAIVIIIGLYSIVTGLVLLALAWRLYGMRNTLARAR